MKKFFAIAAIAVAFVACNNSGKDTKVVDTTVTHDSPIVVPDTTHPAMDTTVKADTTAPKM
jgi:hypothetical protein